MSLTRFTGNTNVISELADAPTLTAEQLKAKFDEADGSEKTFINNTLIPEVEQLVATEKSTLQGLITALGTQLRAEMAQEINAKILSDNQAKYYVGKIIIDTKNINPATYLGFGTWQLWGSGKVPIGVDEEDEDFAEVEQTGGGKLHQHLLPIAIDQANGNWGALQWNNYFGYGNKKITTPNYNIISHDPVGSSRTMFQQYTQWVSNMPPYITCYMWKRIS